MVVRVLSTHKGTPKYRTRETIITLREVTPTVLWVQERKASLWFGRKNFLGKMALEIGLEE